MAWLLLPAAAADGAEWVAHLTTLAMLWLGIAATIALGLRLGLEPGWAGAAGLLLVASPAVLGMGGTAMPDVPAMAFGASALERLAAWSRQRKAHQGALAAVLLALAALTRSHGLLLVGVGVVLLAPAVRAGRSFRERARVVAPLLAAPLLVLILGVVTSDPRGAGGVAQSAMSLSALDLERLHRNLVALPVHWAAAMTFAVPWVAVRARDLSRSASAIAAAACGGAATGWMLFAAGRPSALAPVAAAVGSAALWDVVAVGWRRKDAVHLALALCLLARFPTFTCRRSSWFSRHPRRRCCSPESSGLRAPWPGRSPAAFVCSACCSGSPS